MNQTQIDIEFLRKIIKSKGLKTNWLAHACGVSPTHLYGVLSGRTSPGRGLIKLLAIELKVEEQALIKTKAS